MNYFDESRSKRIKNIHLVGIGGSGMSGVAEVLHNLGFKVTGSDLIKNESTNRLSSLGIEVRFSHIKDNAAYCDALIISSAIAKDNIEVLVAKQRKIPIIHRAEMLAELMRFKYGIAVAGSHGKTTTTSLIATILSEANQDPTFVVGGKLNKFSSNAKLGTGNFFVSEADESDGSFLHFNPLLSVITNIDDDHLCNYANSFDNLKKAFLEFIHRIPFYGLVVACKDDPVISSIIDHISRPILTYGFSQDADLKISNYKQYNNVSNFELTLPGESIARKFMLNLPGRYNVLNAVAAIAVGIELKINVELISDTLMHFNGIGRRFQIHGEFLINTQDLKQFLLIDDYGHHPKEIASVITAIKDGWPNRRLIIVFQPHRYTRTQQLWSEFITVLSMADYIILLDIYSAGEENLTNISSLGMCKQLAEQYHKSAILIGAEQGNSMEILLLKALNDIVKDQDIVLMQGAGDIGKLSTKLISKLQIHEETNI